MTPRAGWLAVAVLAGSQFLAVMSTTVVSVALPAIGAGLHASAAGRLWIVDAYVIVYSALLVVGGTIGDRRGRKGMFLLGLVFFGAGLAATGAAMFGLLRLGPDTGAAATWWDFAVAGAGVGLCLTPMTQVAVSAVPAPRAGMASSVHNALRQFGQVLGVAVLGAIVYAHGPQGFVPGLHAAMWVSGTALLGAAVLAVGLLRPDAAAPPRQSRAEPAALTTARSAK